MQNENNSVTVQWCNDSSSFLFGYIFRDSESRQIIARCDEEEYHMVVHELRKQGYTVAA